MKTKIYKIFLKKNKDGAFEDLELIKDGFSAPALIFSIFTLLYKKLWRQFFIFLFLMIFLVLIKNTYVPSYIILPVQITMCIYIGFEYSDWLSNKLIKDNYQFLGYSSGLDEREAKLKFLDNLNDNYKKDDKLEQKIF